MTGWHSQDRHTVRVEWGPSGARSLCRYAAERGSPVTAVVVDVLSFTTCVSVASDAGTAVLPYRWGAAGAESFARDHDAALAGPRTQATQTTEATEATAQGRISLSPGSIRAAEGVARLVLPSPNGSTISAVLAEAGATVVAGSLRNRSAVGHWLADRLAAAAITRSDSPDGSREPAGGGTPPGPPAILIVPAGERWPDGSLRPAVEDLWGAGGIIDALVGTLGHRAGPLLLSPEAQVALAAYRGVRERLGPALAECGSGRELIEKGFPGDVQIAAEQDQSRSVPVLRGGAFQTGHR